MKLQLVGSGSLIQNISKLYNIEIIDINSKNSKYAPALIFNNDCYYEIKKMDLEDIKKIILKMQEN